MAVVGGFEYDTPEESILERMRAIEQTMITKHDAPKPIDFYVNGKMSSTGMYKFKANEDMVKFVEIYRYTMKASDKPQIRNEHLWVSAHKPFAERRDTRTINLVSTLLRDSLAEPQLSDLVVCKIKGVVWYQRTRIFTYNYRLNKSTWHTTAWASFNLPITAQQAQSHVEENLA